MAAEPFTESAESSDFIALSPEQARHVDEVCDYFEHQMYTQGRPRIEELLGGFSEPIRTTLLRELLLLELEISLTREIRPDPELYYKRFPERRPLIKEAFDRFFPHPPQLEMDDEPWPDIPNYRILRPLNQGGMGKVYEAIHVRLTTRVALKVLHAGLARDVEAESRFEREMKLIGTLAHPNIVVARDAGMWEGRHYLVMEYVEGLDLDVLLKRLGTLPVADACEVGRRVALALDCAHQHNLVHRDIKPKNIVLGRSSSDAMGTQVKVVDFGLASLRGYKAMRDPAVPYARVVGTLAYMAPEQYWEQTSDIRSDIYSLGCTLYCLLVGRPPYARSQYHDTVEIMKAHRDVPASPFRKRRPDVCQSLEETVLKMIAKTPGDRYQTPSELARRLAPFAEGHDLEALLSRGESSSDPLPGPTVKVLAGDPKKSERPLGPESISVTEPFVVNPEEARPDIHVDHPPPPPDQLPADQSSEDREQDATRPNAFRPTRRVVALALVAIFIVAAALLALWLRGDRKPAAIDLLATVNPKRDGTGGSWELDGQALVSPDEPRALLSIRCAPPEQYKLEIEAQCDSGGRLVIGLLYQGRQFPVVLDTLGIESNAPDKNSSSPLNIPPEFQVGEGAKNTYTYTCIVRREGISVAYENEVRGSSFSGEKPLEIDPKWQPKNHQGLFLGTQGSIFRFRTLRLTPLER